MAYWGDQEVSRLIPQLISKEEQLKRIEHFYQGVLQSMNEAHKIMEEIYNPDFHMTPHRRTELLDRLGDASDDARKLSQMIGDWFPEGE